MSTFEEFEQDLQDLLAHLYDPAYHPTALLRAVMGCNERQEDERVRYDVIQAIKALEPAPNVPPGARIRRLYEVLSCRYLQKLTQEETAEQLAITPRHLRREQQKAVRVLAERLWRQREIQAVPADGDVLTTGAGLDMPSPDWRSQVKLEVASLQKSASGSVADVTEAVHGIVKLARPLASKHGVSLDLGSVQPNLIATIHPSALRQILIAAITELVAMMSSGQIDLSARSDTDHIQIIIRADSIVANDPSNGYFAQELLASAGGSLALRQDGETLSWCVTLPSMRRINVLVIDDNADLVHFYRRYAARTRYQITHIAEGERAFEVIEEAIPDIIVLDIMLPDIDGWDLLTQLHAHPTTRLIPVIVCSVVREEEFALALGAALYVAKPVRRQQFIQALDRALSQVVAAEPKARPSNAVTC